MSIVFLTMALSLDGFITGPDDDAQNPAGIDGMRLMDWLDGGGTRQYAQRLPARDPASQLVFDETMSSGAVITGRRTADFAGYWGGDHHDGVPIFVPTHQPPAENPYERVHYVTDGIEACVQQAKAAAGDRDVMLLGAYTAQECLKAGVLDVIDIQLRPVSGPGPTAVRPPPTRAHRTRAGPHPGSPRDAAPALRGSTSMSADPRGGGWRVRHHGSPLSDHQADLSGDWSRQLYCGS